MSEHAGKNLPAGTDQFIAEGMLYADQQIAARRAAAQSAEDRARNERTGAAPSQAIERMNNDFNSRATDQFSGIPPAPAGPADDIIAGGLQQFEEDRKEDRGPQII